MTNKLVVILGPTASGKSALAVKLAQKFNGEIISADSRQVYKGLTIGTAKISKREMLGIPHHLLDVASPKRRFTVAQYKKVALKAIRNIQKRGKLPILVGGSPFYIYSVVDNWTIPQVKPNYRLRKQLGKLSPEQLFRKLKKLDPSRAKTLQQSSGQAKNKRRIIRALEIVLSTGKPVPPLKNNIITTIPWYNNDYVFIGVKKTPQELKKRIRKRISSMFQQGLVQEVKNLRGRGLSWKRIKEFGFEYRFIASYLQEGVRPLQEELKAKIQKATEDFARRQMTWFKKDSRIHWVSSYAEAKRFVEVNLQQS